MIEKNSNFEKLKRTAAQAKQALIENWSENGAFVDNNTLTKTGLMPEGIGLTSLLLMLVAFDDEPDVISEADRENIAKITEESLKKIKDWVEKSGFVATPLLDPRYTEKFFTEETGFMDTLSWSCSASILARYAERENKISLSGDTHDIIFSMIKKALGQLFAAQRADGTWGFAADRGAKRSLYYSYVAGVTLADFFDYALGEIALVEERSDDVDLEEYADKELLEYLDQEFGQSVREMAVQARESLAKWLLKDCLPLLPRLASCREMDPQMMERLGIWKADMPTGVAEDGINYFNLYYTYYLIDLMVVTATDEQYKTILQDADSDKLDGLKKYYKEQLLGNGQPLLDAVSWEYYFGRRSGNRTEGFWSAFMEQAIHASRNQFMAASRTGKKFWDVSLSELRTKWEYEDEERTEDVQDMLVERSVQLTDPAVVPMALRVNALYSYYICKQTDITVDRLFEDICSNAAEETELSCVAHLWDDQNYNLMVTERSIEALVDYYDYLCKFDLQKTVEETAAAKAAEPQQQTVLVEAQKSEFELALEKKIAEYLHSEAGRQAIAEACPAAAQPAAAGAPVSLDVQQLISKLETVQADLRDIDHPLKNSADDETERLLYALKETYNCFAKRALYEFIAAKQTKKGSADKAMENSDKLQLQIEDLLERVVGDMGAVPTLKDLYIRLSASDDI